MSPDLSRSIVVGNSGSGKTTFARELAAKLNQPYVELDVLHWLPGWRERPREVFASLIEQATAGDRWVVDGNYGKMREHTTHWSRATAVVWLNYSLTTNFLRGLRRTLRRSITREELFSGNHETFYRQFLSRESLLLWILSNQARSRRNLSNLRNSKHYAQLSWIEFRVPADANDFLASIVNPSLR
jgi:adenylate kinase family enzyme